MSVVVRQQIKRLDRSIIRKKSVYRVKKEFVRHEDAKIYLVDITMARCAISASLKKAPMKETNS